MLQITYQKNDGSIILKKRNTMLPYKIGEITSMGWKVLNIEYEYKNQYYPLHEYNMIIEKNKQIFYKKKATKELLIKEIKTFAYCFSTIVIINFVKILFGM